LIGILVPLGDELLGEHTTGTTWATAGSTGTARTTPTAVRSTGTTPAALSGLGRHGGFVVELGNGDQERAFLAFARNDNLAIFTATKNGFETVDAKVALRPFRSVAAEAGVLKKRADVLFEGQPRFIGGGWQLGEVRRTGENRRREGDGGEEESRGV
jgi:hypothetical protein